MASLDGVLATRLGMMNGGTVDCLPRVSSIGPNGLLSFQVIVRASVAARLSVWSKMCWPPVSRSPQRLSEATTSAAVTGAPSWNHRFSRSVKV
ncbi:Uncharacterised protein [Bordetella pertussis]|nr:Uncharacterised protein [Bordetella pertussis]CPM61755.1 Uncharacterised protein [Bordetella pertussis]